MNQPVLDPIHFEYRAKLPGIVAQLRGGLIVACQAEAGESLYGPEHMAAMAGTQYGYDYPNTAHSHWMWGVRRTFNQENPPDHIIWLSASKSKPPGLANDVGRIQRYICGMVYLS
jgi:hypothetical protein